MNGDVRHRWRFARVTVELIFDILLFATRGEALGHGHGTERGFANLVILVAI